MDVHIVKISIEIKMKDEKIKRDNSDNPNKQNRIKVLQLIRNKKEITRAEIIKLSGLSAPTITRIVENLVQQNLIKTDGIGSSIGGRRPQLFNFQSKNNYVIGIDIGGTFIRSALSNLDGEFIFEIHLPTDLKNGFEAVMQQVGNMITKLSKRAIEKNLTLRGIGIAICGMVNKQTGIVEYSPIFGWKKVDVAKALKPFTPLNIALGNVVQLFALGELLYGVGKKYSDFICVNLGYGIGSGIIIDSKLFGGADGISGEIGHIVVNSNSSRKGLDGVSGTLEAEASGHGIEAIAKKQALFRKDSILHSIETSKINAKTVFDAAKKNDALANEILENVANSICIGIDTLIKLFNTTCIVLSGGLIENEPILLDLICSNMPNFSMKSVSRSVPILTSSFGENAALMGSFSLILEKILKLEHSPTHL
ncbi:MAG: ROK family transcriptional regulator [Prolixibacteraceae bacterium]|nr:ROK family transcriptional regulator [Prolixibacteraceae bacterium]